MRYIKPIVLILIGIVLIATVISLSVPERILAGGQVVTTSDDQTEIAITVYNDGTGLVKDTREIDLPGGEVELKFMDVAATIDPTSVHFVSNSDPGSIEVLEQNYEYDLVDTTALFQKHIDKPIVVRMEDGREISGILLSWSGGYVVQTDAGLKILHDAVEVRFEDLPDGLLTRPTLRWTLNVNRDAMNEVEMSYLTTGMSWRANYVAVVGQDDDILDLSGWVTINNTSGANYYDAMLKLVAGDIHRVQPEQRYSANLHALGYMNGASGGGGFEEESFFEYHLYTLQRPATVLNNQQKQISLMDGEEIGVQKIFVFSPGSRYYSAGETFEADIEVRLKFMNSENNGLGIPLPKGILRVYKEDSSGSLQFIGEDNIDHTPKDEEIEIFLGEAFDIVGERSIRDRRSFDFRTWEYDVEITIRNHKDDDVEVVYWDRVWGDWSVTTSSLDWEQKDASTIEFKIPVEADGETVLCYTIRREA